MLIDRYIVTKQVLKTRTILLQIIATITIVSMILPIVLSHISTLFYQLIYFSIYSIPKARLRDYIIIDRHKLKKLNWGQKLSCAYCGYANGLAAWLKTVANRTELYSCAIKHSVTKEGQEHQKEFFEYEKFQ